MKINIQHLKDKNYLWEVVKELEVEGETIENCFVAFYKMNNRLKYCCDREQYRLADKETQDKYNQWENSLSYSESMRLYYGVNGIVD